MIFINDSTNLSFCVCLPRKYMGLKVKVCFAGAWFGCWVYGFGCFARDMVMGFGLNLGLGISSLLEIDYGEEHKEHEYVLLKK